MVPETLASNFAYSLTRGAWTRDAIERTLRRRVPQDLQTEATLLSVELLEEFPSATAPKRLLVTQTLRQSPTFQRIATYSRRHNIQPAVDLRTAEFAPLEPFARLDLPRWNSVQNLVDDLGLLVEQLNYLSDPTSRHERHGDMAVNHYHYHFSPKRNGRTRLIEAPKQRLKSLQRKILTDVLNQVPISPQSFGFVKGRTALSAAARHAGEEVVLRFDLRDFFASVGAHRVYGVFRSLGYPQSVAQLLTGLCCTATPPRVLDQLHSHDRATFRQQHLPQGAPTSPALSNLVCFNLDRRLSGLARQIGANYTRYADDLCFSGDAPIAQRLVSVVPKIVTSEGFALNESKTVIQRHTGRQTVLGVVINQHVNIGRDEFDRLKAVIHAVGRTDDSRATDMQFMASLIGTLAWVETVNPRKGLKLQSLLAKALERRKKGGP